LAVVDFVMKLEERKKLKDFIYVRENFENFLQNYDYLIKQIFYEKHRDVQKSYKEISIFFEQLVIHLKGGLTLDDTLKKIISSPDFK
jgi:type II secretory pathway component PulF